MGPPEGAASSGSTSPPLDMALLRERAAELGYWPATTDEADIERHRSTMLPTRPVMRPTCGSTGREAQSAIDGTT
jgi:hypothetical protein